ncbi:major facilitator superfamily domain-containing protein [Diaporthe sp. PMI_573]|nr:major facilitator superfamily domain-containing protein [Diaporthaceae sp. PMI_573]
MFCSDVHSSTTGLSTSASRRFIMNWSTARKTFNFSITLIYTLVVFTALSIQTSFWGPMSTDMGVSVPDLNRAVSVNLIGLALGCVFFVPFTKKYGRRSTYVISSAAMAASSFWSAGMKTLAELYLTNLIQGLAGATNEVIVQMTVADLFFVHQRAKANTWYMSMVMAGSFLMPVGFSVQATVQSWRSAYWTLASINAFIFVLFAFFYEETKFIPPYQGIPIQRLAPRVSMKPQEDGDDEAKLKQVTSSTETIHFDSNISTDSWRTRLRWTTKTSESLSKLFYQPFIVLFQFPIVLFCAVQYASGLAWLTLISNVTAIVFAAPPYNFGPDGIGYMGLGPFAGNVIGSIYGGVLGDWIVVFASRRNNGIFEPEMRLYILFLPAICMSAGLAVYGVTTDKGMHWIYPSIGGAIMAFGLGSIGDIAITVVIDAYKEMVGEAFTGVTFIRNAVAVVIPFAIDPWMRAMTLTNMFVVCAVVSLLISLLFVPLLIWGKRMRVATAAKYYKMLEQQKSL